MGKIMFHTGKFFYIHIEIVCAFPDILKMGIWKGAMKSLGRTLLLITEVGLNLMNSYGGCDRAIVFSSYLLYRVLDWAPCECQRTTPITSQYWFK